MSDIKVGDEFIWDGPESKWVTRGKKYKVVSTDGMVYIETDHGPYESGQLTFQKHPAYWRRIDAPTVRVGQVWRREQDSQKFTLTSLHRPGWWNAKSCDVGGEDGYFYEKDGTLPNMTLVRDVAEEKPAALQVSGYVRLSPAQRSAAMRCDHGLLLSVHCFDCAYDAKARVSKLTVDDDTGSIFKTFAEAAERSAKRADGSKYVVGIDYGYVNNGAFDMPAPTAALPWNPSGPAADREIAARMEAVNAAFHDRHKEQIKQAWAATSEHWTIPDTGACRWQRRR